MNELSKTMPHHDFTPRTSIAISQAMLGVLCGMSIGIKFADIDLVFPAWLLYHRALLTHGLIVPLLLSWVVWRTRHQFLRGLTIGFCVTNAVHLSFDLFPRAWWGHALIHLFWVTFPPLLSWIWIAGSIVMCLYLWRLFVRTLWEISLSSVGLIAGFVVYAHEGIFFPLLALSLASAIAFFFPQTTRKETRE